ncbi:MAG TPA: hypothetical protein DCP53_01245, partial [Elusimicrobia bacterium]|nr:hypothetical protein [Elusimicrobiota bacterium]
MKYKNPGPNIIKNRLGTMRILCRGFAFFLLIFLLTISHSYASIFNYSSTTFNISGSDNCKGIAVNPTSGDVYINGSYFLTTQNIVIAKFNSSLVFQSSINVNGAGNNADTGWGIAVSPRSGDVYATGQVYENSTFNMWVAKYNSSLVLQASSTYNGSGNSTDECYNVAIGTDNSVYVIGSIYETNGTNIRIMKFNSSLAFISSITINGVGNGADEGFGIAVDTNNNVYTTGKVFQNATLDIWIAKYSSELVLQSSTTVNGSGNNEDVGRSITTYGDNVYVTGYVYEGSNSKIWIAKYNSLLVPQYSFTIGDGANMYQGQGITVDANGNVYVTGLTNTANQDIFLGEYDSDLNLISSMTINGSNNSTDGGFDIVFDTNTNNVYMAGTSLEAVGATNMWLSKHKINNTISGIFSGNFSQINGAVYGADFNDFGYDIVVDTFTGSSPYIFVTGTQFNNSTNFDFFTIKYNASGNMISSATLGGGIYNDSDSLALKSSIAIDYAGNVFITGIINTGVDSDFIILKYNNNLVFQSSGVFNGGNNDWSEDVAVDNSGNVFVTGTSNNGSSLDFLTLKYNNNLVYLSSAVFDSDVGEYGHGIAIDNSGNVFVTGQIDFAPGDWVVLKYNNNLVYQSSNVFIGSDLYGKNNIITDNSGNVYITAYSDNSFLIKYNNNLVFQSSTVFYGAESPGSAVTKDVSGNIYVTGEKWNSSNYDYVTAKYNNNLIFQSSAIYNSGFEDSSFGVFIDSTNNVYVTGTSLNGSSNYDFRTIKFELYSDDILPAGISDLTALTGANQGEIVLKWTAPGDDGDSGTINGQYEIKFTSISQITSTNYGSPPNPTYTINISTYYSQPLLEHTTTLYNLQSETIYWFAIKVRDESYNWSVWNSSNEASVNLSASTTTLNPDTTLPTSGITCPDTPFVKSLLTISGTANDNTGLENVSIRISSYTSGDWITQQNWTIVQDSATWQYMYSNWQNGVKYKIEVKAKDTLMNEQNPLTSHEFTYDISMPTVTITSPDTGFVNSDNLTSISGTALDYPTGPSPDFASPGGILKVQIRIKSQYGNSYWDGSSNNYAIDSSNSEMAWYDAIAVNSDWTVWKSTKPMLYNTSSYVLEAKAIDKAGNSTTYISTRSFIVDNVKPQSSVESPANFSTRCNFSTFDTISGTSSDDESSVANVKVYIRKNSAPYKWYLKDGEPGFSEDVETPNNATNVASWTFELLENKLTSGVSYYIYSSAQDSANNSEDLPGSGPSTFLWDVTEPTSVVKNANV